ncbi:Sir2 family NAD-dependent protein deacetylase [Variovorax sp. EL159]|uniref:SIR2 family NAD-dependent protein deacylase n=1 Tax=Variovorax sp. EL159 TaxID=1566270 RepID=UPI0008860FAA|nr:Sir2 family NAD-dependent protein deacetylase [Variovorax sp. EL159]SCX56825.1 NAD-dependent protein deacetylase, SIR2 family [Variovorax sp. EL159]
MTIDSDTLKSIDAAAVLLAEADALIIGAGAGMGVDSGLPDFRGGAGFWSAYPALARSKISFHDIASPEAFRNDPVTAWGFYGHRLNLYRKTRPHDGFALLKSWGEKMEKGYSVFTSNVDGHFQKAGFSEDAIYECHGSIHHLQCAKPCGQQIWSADDFIPEVDEAECRLLSLSPACPRCAGLARPNVMMFSDFEWREGREQAQATRMHAWLASVRRPVVIEIGAGTAIPSVRSFSHNVVGRFDGRLIRINPREFDVPTSRDVALPMGAMRALSLLANALEH